MRFKKTKKKCLCCCKKFEALHARGLCHKCYDLEKRKGNLDNYKKSNTKENEIIVYETYAEVIVCNRAGTEAKVLIDIEDLERVKKYKWNFNDKGYIANSKIKLLSKFILKLSDLLFNVVHRNGNKFDCRKENLELISRSNNFRKNKDIL